MCRKRKLIVAFLLREIIGDDQEEEVLLTEYAKPRKQVSDVFKSRRNEGTFNSLIKTHLLDEEEKFQRYFRLTRERFSFVLNLVEDELTISSYNRVKQPINAAEKLALTLR